MEELEDEVASKLLDLRRSLVVGGEGSEFLTWEEGERGDRRHLDVQT